MAARIVPWQFPFHLYIFWLFVQFSADVVGCNRDPATNLVEVLDTYNEAAVRNNQPDPTQDVVLFNSSFDGTRIFCTLVECLLASLFRYGWPKFTLQK